MADPKPHSQLAWMDIYVQDLDRAIKWYSAVLGNEVSSFDIGGGHRIGVLHHHMGSGACLVVEPHEKPGATGPLVYLNCNGRLDAAIDAVEPNGGKVLKPKLSIAPHGWRAVVLDSEGNRLALHSM